MNDDSRVIKRVQVSSRKVRISHAGMEGGTCGEDESMEVIPVRNESGVVNAVRVRCRRCGSEVTVELVYREEKEKGGA